MVNKIGLISCYNSIYLLQPLQSSSNKDFAKEPLIQNFVIKRSGSPCGRQQENEVKENEELEERKRETKKRNHSASNERKSPPFKTKFEHQNIHKEKENKKPTLKNVSCIFRF